MSKRTTTLLPLACAALVACTPDVEPLEPIVIGVLNPTTGQLGSLGPGWEDASRLAAEQVNAAGGLFDGRRLELRFYDTATNPNRAVEAVHNAMSDGAVALVGPASSGEAAETLDVVAGYQVPQISCCATSPGLTEEGGWFFRTTPNDLLQAKAVAYLAGEGWSETVTREPCAEAALVYRDDSYGSGLAEVFRAEYVDRPIAGTNLNGKLVADVAYEADPADVEAMGQSAADEVMEELRANHHPGVEQLCVLLISFAPDGAAIINPLDSALNQADDLGTLEHAYLATDGLYDDAFASLARGAATNMLGTAPTHADNLSYAKFTNAYRARFGVDPGNLTSNMYDAVVLLSLALTKGGSAEGADIREALFDVSRGGRLFEGAFFGEMAEALLSGEDIDYEGPTGPLDFDERGDVIGDFTLWQPVNEANNWTIRERAFLPATLFAE